MKQILVISDPELEVDFDTLCNYCAVVQERLGSSVAVLPIWPHGKAELIGDKRKMKLQIKHIQDVLKELEIEMEGEDERK